MGGDTGRWSGDVRSRASILRHQRGGNAFPTRQRLGFGRTSCSSRSASICRTRRGVHLRLPIKSASASVSVSQIPLLWGRSSNIDHLPLLQQHPTVVRTPRNHCQVCCLLPLDPLHLMLHTTLPHIPAPSIPRGPVQRVHIPRYVHHPARHPLQRPTRLPREGFRSIPRSRT